MIFIVSDDGLYDHQVDIVARVDVKETARKGFRRFSAVGIASASFPTVLCPDVKESGYCAHRNGRWVVAQRPFRCAEVRLPPTAEPLWMSTSFRLSRFKKIHPPGIFLEALCRSGCHTFSFQEDRGDVSLSRACFTHRKSMSSIQIVPLIFLHSKAI